MSLTTLLQGVVEEERRWGVMAKLIGMTMGVSATAALGIMYLIPNPYVFLAALMVWWGALFAFNQHYAVHLYNILLQLATSISFIILVSILEQPYLIWFLIVVAGFVFFTLWQWSFLYERDRLSLELKPHRRIALIIWTFNVYSWYTALYAIATFFTQVPFWIVSFAGALLGGGAAAMAWNLYYDVTWHQWSVWVALVSLIMFELAWVMNALPFGYLVLGLLLSWFWYIVQLFIRFRVSPKGIVWKRQRWFLVINGCLLLFVLSLVRWI